MRETPGTGPAAGRSEPGLGRRPCPPERLSLVWVRFPSVHMVGYRRVSGHRMDRTNRPVSPKPGLPGSRTTGREAGGCHP